MDGSDATDEKAESGRALVDVAQGFFRGKVLCAAVRLGIADALAAGPMTVDDLAAEIGAVPAALQRLLRALAMVGVVELEGQAFVLTSLGELLRRDVEQSVWADIVFWADLLDDAWTHLSDCVRAGGVQGAVEARTRSGAISRWDTERDARAIFQRVFARASDDEMVPYACAYDFSSRRHVADLGGGGGALLRAILRDHPNITGLLLDRGDAIEGAGPLFADAGLADRCEFVVGDLLDSVPIEPDTYVMKAVLHVYEDIPARQILDNCHTSMSANDRLLIVETILPDHLEPGDAAGERAIMSDLNMLAVTGGKERTVNDWQTLLASAGFKIANVATIPGEARHSVIEAIPT